MTYHKPTYIAEATVSINAPIAAVWHALRDPELIRQYMFGAEVDTDWREGEPIVWRGEWQGTAYEDRGTVLQVEPQRVLQYSHYSPLSGEPDAPENYHVVTITLFPQGEETAVILTQDNNRSDEARRHSEQNWQMMLDNLKSVVEQ